ncbi:MAG TPA: type IX secretion system membrane protein PorP/SprF [Bacteroidia bacterium]|nr:type IX secretion system membrane protein PorP/SprF [Bacteroidia bacterium]
MKKFILSLALLAGFIAAKAQQLPMFSQYMINDFVLNPAVAGTLPYYEAASNNRYQWQGITDAPRTYTLSVNGPCRGKNMGLGGYIYTDNTGPTRRTGFEASYAYHVRLTESLRLSFGLSVGIQQFAIDGSEITLRDPGDLVLSNQLQSVLVPDFAAGMYLYTDRFYFGFSVPQILQSKLKFFDNIPTPLSDLASHYYATIGYKFKLSDDFELQPTAMAKYVYPAPVQVDIGLRLIYQNQMWIGADYRTMDAIAAMIGYTVKKNLLFGFSYDFTTTDIRKYSSGTYELMIGIKFDNHTRNASQSQL